MVFRSNGINSSEKYLQNLCERSFLKLWSYPGIYRKKIDSESKIIGKEVCDLLVVFENHIIIFSDKNISFPNTGDIDLDWSRWVRKAVLESGKQVYGAERWIRNYPNNLFLDQQCRRIFPLDFPDMSIVKFHRIVVAHGSSERCKSYLGGSGSLMINSNIIGTDHLLKISEGGQPFTVGQIDPQRGFIHILDDTTLNILLTTLDTVYEFISYLDKKESLIRSKIAIFATGEENLLAYYFSNLNDRGEHDFIIDSNVDAIGIDEGFWTEFSTSAARQSQIEANKISYAWDSLIETFSNQLFAISSIEKNNDEIKNLEKVLRFFARESRTERRLLAKLLGEMLDYRFSKLRFVRVIIPKNQNDPYFFF